MPNRIEQVASKAMGKVKAVKAQIKGLKGIFKTLAEEHGEALGLLKRVAMTSDPSVRAELFPKIKMELLGHEQGELSELYPLLKENRATREIAEEHEKEARELEGVLRALEEQDYDSPQWEQTFKGLVEMVERHTTKEENDYFPKAQDVLGEPRAEQLNERYLAKKANMQAH